MTKLDTHTGQTLTYKDPVSGSGWTTGKIGRLSVGVYIRPAHQGAGVFVDLEDGAGLVDAKTGEKTVWFNNRYWTLTEERDHIERIKADESL